jgi:hypothetical protein
MTFHFTESHVEHRTCTDRRSQHSKVISSFSLCLILSNSRFLLYVACQKYVLRSLYSDLKTLSSGHTASDSNPGSPDPAIELDALPLPTTQANSQSIINNKPLLQSTISRNVFSVAFMESCMMFVLLMLQATGTFSPRYALLQNLTKLFAYELPAPVFSTGSFL